MSDAYTDTILRQMTAAAGAEMQKLGGEIEQDIRQRASDPYPPASEPGNPPHSRTGGYLEQFTHAVEQGDDRVDLIVSNPDVLALWLEKGTVKMRERPHFKPTGDDWKDRVAQRTAAAAESSSSTT